MIAWLLTNPHVQLAFVSKDPTGWWEVLEVNIRGVYNFIQWVYLRIMKEI
jgi:hypothetical protein